MGVQGEIHVTIENQNGGAKAKTGEDLRLLAKSNYWCRSFVLLKGSVRGFIQRIRKVYLSIYVVLLVDAFASPVIFRKHFGEMLIGRKSSAISLINYSRAKNWPIILSIFIVSKENQLEQTLSKASPELFSPVRGTCAASRMYAGMVWQFRSTHESSRCFLIG